MHEVIIIFTNHMPSDMLFELWHRDPDAAAFMHGSPQYPDIAGIVFFYVRKEGVYVTADIFGLPKGTPPCQNRIFAFHIHTGSECSGNSADPFADTMGHFNPSGCDHPYHAGDLPPLFECGGHAWMTVLTDRFTVDDIIGKTVVIHSAPDDFHSQPSGNSGEKIVCGVIERIHSDR